jgi:carbon-monoxide dehydrogenase medium subunit
MIPAQFEYHRPTSVADAIGLLAQHGDEARVVAGGHSLIPMMKLRMAQPEHLVDLQDVSELKYVLEDGNDIVIGAMTTQSEIIASDLLARKCPILAEAALQISDPQVRNMGTLGGNVANGDPGNDMPAVMQALDARFNLTGPNGTRQVAARDFYDGPFMTALQEGEILAAVRFATPPAGHGWSYSKQKRKIGDYATAAAAVILTLSGDNCTDASISLTNVAPTPLYAEAASKTLVGTSLDAAAIDKAAVDAMAITDPASDGRGPAEFRTRVTGVMVRRAIEAARERAAG